MSNRKRVGEIRVEVKVVNSYPFAGHVNKAVEFHISGWKNHPQPLRLIQRISSQTQNDDDAIKHARQNILQELDKLANAIAQVEIC